jgi:FAD/FMN-containing dehydrogenase
MRAHDASVASVPGPALRAFGERFHGRLISPADEGYDEARSIWNGAIDRRPGLVARCADASDVRSAVRFAREHDLRISVRSGGHGVAGLALCDDGLVVDLSALKSVRVDEGNRLAEVDAGVNLGELDRATQAFGLAVPAGIVTHTGVAGLTLGGGIGWLTRKHGLSVDNLLGADVVTADGELVAASEHDHPDLFWGLRGGGGNFGVVTSFLFRCHPVGEHGMIIGGPVLYDIADVEDLFRWYRELLPALPEEVSGWIGVTVIPSGPPFPEHLWGRKAGIIVWSYTGPHAKADEVLAPIRSFGNPLLVGLQPMPFSVLQTAFDALMPTGLQWYWKVDFFEEITDDAIAVHRRYGETIPTPLSTMHMYPISGAAARVPEDATAFAYRNGGWTGVIAGIDPDPANLAAVRSWAQQYWQELHASSAGGGYVNMMMEDEGEERIKAAYRGNYDRLSQIKKRYDPTNLFHINQNIPPAA